MASVKITVTGRLYKTGYRFYLKQIAERLDITGSIHYSVRHQVEVMASGREIQLEKFITFCRLGCIGSKVRKLVITELTSDPMYESSTMDIID